MRPPIKNLYLILLNQSSFVGRKKTKTYPIHVRKIAIVGSTGLVGQALQELLRTKSFSSQQILPLSSKDGYIPWDHCNLCFLCVPENISQKLLATRPPANKTFVIDHSSAFRLQETIPLVIPEINGHLLKTAPLLVASPNCTTTLLSLVAYPLHTLQPISRIICSTYQAISGAGKKKLNEFNKHPKHDVYIHESPEGPNHYNEEELKMLHETRKILQHPTLQLSATCARVPTPRVHSIAANIEFQKPVCLDAVKRTLSTAPGIVLLPQAPSTKDAQNNPLVFCGRVRQDICHPCCIEIWISGDQLLKGAAWNSLQIAELLL